MERDKICKIQWRAFMHVIYNTPRMVVPCDCMVVSINFDDETAILRPIDKEMYIDEDIFANLKYVELPRPKPRLLKSI